MARTDYDLLSTSPPEEPCVQGDDDPILAQEEGMRYIDLIRRTCGPEPEGACLKVRGNPHDLGTYYTVVLFLDDAVEEHVAYMQGIELDGPLEWDEETHRDTSVNVDFDHRAGRNPNF